MADYYDSEKEKKALYANKDYELLSNPGTIGFYTCVEVVQIFLVDKTTENKTQNIKNIYTLFTFSEQDFIKSTFKYVLEKPKSLSKDYSIGIIKGIISIDDAYTCFFNIQKGLFSLNGENCSISNKLFLLPKSLVSKENMKYIPMLNKVIKPNYWGDNYIIEFFDEEKSFFKSCLDSRKYIEKICNILKNISEINIDLSKVRDRFGNILFQFPITIYKTTVELLQDFITIKIKGEAHPLLTTSKDLSLYIRSTYDDLITGDYSCNVNSLSFLQTCVLGDDNNIEITIRDNTHNLLIHHSLLIFTKYIQCAIHSSIENGPQREIRDRNGNVISVIDIFHTEILKIGKNQEKTYETYIYERQKNNEIIHHSNDYLVVLKDQREEAFDFISQRMKKNDLKEICLWDPYLSAIDIIAALYTENTGVPFRCITSYKKSNTIKDEAVMPKINIAKSFLEYKQKMNDDFNSLSNNYGVTLKFLAQHDQYGWEFHDRFLILIPTDELNLPEVYSLGTSINMVGKTHHIIQKITNPNIILSNFENLWKELDNSNCIITEFNKGVRK